MAGWSPRVTGVRRVHEVSFSSAPSPVEPGYHFL
ncbi:hypothetical protein ACLKA7_005561, partial [Drosophila subpalustris]